MPREEINIGAVENDRTGDKVRDAYIKVNNMTSEIYTTFGDGIALTGAVSKTGTPLNSQLAVWTGDTIIEGAADLTWETATGELTISTAEPEIVLDDTSQPVVHRIVSNNSLLQFVADRDNTDVSSGIQFSVDGNEVLRINDTGQLGIGTPTPLNELHIEGTTAAIRLNNTTTGTGHAIVESFGFNSGLNLSADPGNLDAGTYIRFSVDGNEVTRIDENGRLGIGTATPEVLLHVVNLDVAGTFQFLQTHVDNGNDAELIFRKARGGVASPSQITANDDVGTIIFQGWNGASWGQAARIQADTTSNTGDLDGNLRFYTSQIEALRIDENQNLILPANGYIQATTDVRSEIGAAYALNLADTNGIVTIDNAGANTVTINAVGTTPYPIGYTVEIIQLGAGVTTIDAAVGVTLNGVSGGAGAMTAQYGVVKLRHIASNIWIVDGDIGAIA